MSASTAVRPARRSVSAARSAAAVRAASAGAPASVPGATVTGPATATASAGGGAAPAVDAAACAAPAGDLAAGLPEPLPVLGLDVTVPLADGRRVPYAALDQAASAPVLRQVWDEVAEYVPFYGSVHRGAGHLSQLSTGLFEDARESVARFLDCREDDQVVFTRATTDSLNLLASALPDDCRVYVFETEHHAALLPWRGARVTFLDAPASPAEAVARLEEALTAREDDGPALVCVTGASNVTGELWPVRELAAVAHAHGARIVLDAAQLAPHRPVSVRELDVDWVAFSGHKLYAPFGAGVLAGRTDWLDAAEPYLAGGGASRRVLRREDGGLDVEWHTGPARHEAGSPNVVGVHALASACRALAEADLAVLAAREEALLGRLREGLAALPRVRVLSLFGDDAARVGVVSFVVDGLDGADLADRLASSYGIGVRAGLFCAHPLVRRLLGEGPDTAAECGTGGASPLDAVRVSFGVGTPVEHVDRLLGALAELTGETL